MGGRADWYRAARLVSVTDLMRLMGQSDRLCARKMLRKWYQEQINGGPIRVVVVGHDEKNNKPILATTREAMREFFPKIRDEALVKEVTRIRDEQEFLLEQMNRLMRERDDLTKRVEQLERMLGRRFIAR